ncbi:MAG: hypothetical protein ACOY94_00415 [Bacillota bacterium]
MLQLGRRAQVEALLYETGTREELHGVDIGHRAVVLKPPDSSAPHDVDVGTPAHLVVAHELADHGGQTLAGERLADADPADMLQRNHPHDAGLDQLYRLLQAAGPYGDDARGQDPRVCADRTQHPQGQLLRLHQAEGPQVLIVRTIYADAGYIDRVLHLGAVPAPTQEQGEEECGDHTTPTHRRSLRLRRRWR